MTTAIVVILVLVAVGTVVDQLGRLSKWLKNSPPPVQEEQPPDG